MTKRDEVITIIGGSGFLGSYIVRELAQTGARINVVSRTASRHLDLKVNGYVGQIALTDIDVANEKSLEKVIKGSTYVINLIGILFEKGKRTFEKLHAELPKSIGELCKKYKVKKLVHLSALGIDKAKTSKYAQSKLKGEKNIKSAFPDVTILRPSVIFGPEDNFTNLFNWMSKISPFLPLIDGGKTVFQPVYVGDVAKVVKEAITSKKNEFEGKTLELGGPEQLSFEQILHTIQEITGRKRIMLPTPFSIAKAQAFFCEFAPTPLLTRDQVELLKYDNIVFNENGFSQFNFKPHRFKLISATYLK